VGYFFSLAGLPRDHSGASLAELMVVVAILALLAAAALPISMDLAARQRLRGAADNLRGDLNFARSEAVKRRAAVFVTFSPGGQWCYAVTLDAACGCGIPCATPDSLLRQTFSSEAAAGVTMQSAAFAGSFCGGQECVRFEAFHGNAMGSNGTAIFQGAEGSQYKVIVSALGRIRACRYSGDTGGFLPAC
jgi:type IV fimbrial biogenesis protein FimT